MICIVVLVGLGMGFVFTNERKESWRMNSVMEERFRYTQSVVVFYLATLKSSRAA
jgi:hypothetical protein